MSKHADLTSYTDRDRDAERCQSSSISTSWWGFNGVLLVSATVVSADNSVRDAGYFYYGLDDFLTKCHPASNLLFEGGLLLQGDSSVSA